MGFKKKMFLNIFDLFSFFCEKKNHLKFKILDGSFMNFFFNLFICSLYRRPLPSTAGDNLNFMFTAGAVNVMLCSNKELGSS